MEIEFEYDGKMVKAEVADVVPATKVDEIRSQSFAKGAEKAKAEVMAEAETLRKELADAQSKLQQTTSKSTSSSEQINLLTQSLEAVRGQLDAMQNKASEAEQNSQILEATSGMQLVDGAVEIFKAQAKNRSKDGSYLLSTGENGDIKQYAAEFFASAVGKALVISSQKGGTGSPMGSLSGATLDPKSMASKANYIAEHGLDAYQELIRSGKFKKT